MKESYIKNAELAVVISLYDVTKGLKPGRLKNLLKQLQKEGKKEIHKIKEPDKTGMDQIKSALDEFEKTSGWGRSEKHLQTYVNSILMIIEKRNYTKINKLLVDIMDYQQRAKKIPDACFWSAEIVQKKWEDAFNGK